jgi:two-component system, OmpR family, alkaline phosphatase synthesis response regulator PhoP
MAIATVCVIEDDEGIRETVRDLLIDVGYDVIEASTGLAGKQILDASAERLIVVLDYRLPALDGCDLLEIVAQDEDLRERHTIIMMSASPARTIEDCEEAIDELEVPIISKPFNIDDLLEAIRQAQMRLDPGGEPTPAGN